MELCVHYKVVFTGLSLQNFSQGFGENSIKYEDIPEYLVHSRLSLSSLFSHAQVENQGCG